MSVQGWRVTVRKKIVNFLKPTQTALFFCRRVHHPSWTHYWQIVRGWTLVIDGPFKCALVCGCKTTLRCPQRPPLVPQTKQTIKQKSPLLSHERRICPRRTFLGGVPLKKGLGWGWQGSRLTCCSLFLRPPLLAVCCSAIWRAISCVDNEKLRLSLFNNWLCSFPACERAGDCSVAGGGGRVVVR